MTTFKEIRGQLIRSVSSDPANPQEGQIWYNNTIGVLKGEEFLEAWSSGANLPTAVFRSAAFGTLTAAVSTGGSNNPPQALPATTSSFEYNGSAWTTGGALNTARRGLGASGEQTSGLAFGGEINPGATSGATESYNGASWTSVNSMNTARSALAGDGTQTNSLIAGGLTTVNVNITETWDGTNWTTSPATLNTTRRTLGISGDSAAAVGFAGETIPSSQLTSSEDYNGTVWTAGNPTNVASATIGAAGTATTALKFGGRNPSPTVSTEGYDGTSWSTRPNMATGRAWVGGTGTQTAALAAGGEYTSNPISNVVEEFISAPTTKTFTTS